MNTVAIVGAGPRGLSLAERVAAIASRRYADEETTILLIDPFGPGGRVWRNDQSASLLMNTTAGDATLYLDETVAVPGDHRSGPTLFEWARQRLSTGDGFSADPEIALEVATLTPFTSVSRRLYGIYLRSVFEDLMATLPDCVRIVVHQSRVDRVERVCGGERLTLDSGERLYVDAVALALGHVEGAKPVDVDALSEASAAGGWIYIAPGHPAEQDLAALRPGEPVAVRGLGLNFFDLMALLTLGRGGVFTDQSDGGLQYLPSGEEPVLWVGARRGAPFKAKATLIDRRLPPQVRRYPDEATLRALIERADGVSFDDDVWPWVRKEAAWHAFATEVRLAYGGRIDELSEAFDKAAGTAIPPSEELRALFPECRFDYRAEASGDPLAGRTFADGDGLDSYLLEWMERDVLQSDDAANSPEKEGDRAVGASRSWVFPLAEYGGLDGASHVERFAGWFEGYANSLAGGPPALRLRQLAALVKAGIVHMVGAGMRVEVIGGGVRISSASVPDRTIDARVLIDARLADGDVHRSADALVSGLVSSGRVRAYHVRTSTGTTRALAGLDVSTAPFAVVDREGIADPRLFALGVPVGPHSGTSLTAYARANAPFFRQTDAVARALLAVSREGEPDRARCAMNAM